VSIHFAKDNNSTVMFPQETEKKSLYNWKLSCYPERQKCFFTNPWS